MKNTIVGFMFGLSTLALSSLAISTESGHDSEQTPSVEDKPLSPEVQSENKQQQDKEKSKKVQRKKKRNKKSHHHQQSRNKKKGAKKHRHHPNAQEKKIEHEDLQAEERKNTVESEKKLPVPVESEE